MNKKLMLVFTIALAFVACKKDDDNSGGTNNPGPSQSRTQLLCNKNWVSTGYTKNGVDLWPNVSACGKDDIVTFKADGTFIYDNGPTNCSPSDPQTYTSTWRFIEDDTKMISNDDTSEVTELTTTKMVLKSEHLGSVYISTYTAQ